MGKRKNKSFLVVVFLVVLCLNGCAWLSVTPPEEALQERVSLYMQARVDGRWGDVYEFFFSPYKDTVSKEQFVTMPGDIDFLTFTVEDIQIADSEKEATVTVKVDFMVKGFEFKDSPYKQTWVKEGRKWYIKVATKPQTPFD